MHRPILFAAVLALSLAAQAQTATPAASSTHDRWLHVRVQSAQPKNENVRVNVPLELAEKVLAAIKDDHLYHGKIKIDVSNSKDIDIRALFDAIRTTKDGEFVTVQSNDEDVRVAKQNGYFLVHVHDKDHGKREQVEIRIPMKVAEAMLSAANNELDLAAAIRALSAQGDTELVSVKSDEETVRIWLDSKNLSD
ncbi:MAG TPA: hypothetical protein VMI10_11485 [Terriglobales bacterium]|nr:hypothetical protein [Terriglobales bacterium]